MKSVFDWYHLHLILTFLFISCILEISEGQSNSSMKVMKGDSVVPFNQLPAPVISIYSTVDTLCAIPVDLGSYQWYRCGEAKILSRSSCLVIESSGCYCVEGKNALGRSGEICTEFYISGTAPLFQDAIHITPNPAYGNFHIALTHNSFLPVKWILMDSAGKEMKTDWQKELSDDLDFSAIRPGIYIIKFFSQKNEMALKRIIIAE